MAAASLFILLLLLLLFLQTVLSQQRQPSLLEDGPSPSPSPSPLGNGSLLEQLEAPIKELKVWLRDTELLIFNSCLREQQEASQQLHSFKVAASLRRWGGLPTLPRPVCCPRDRRSTTGPTRTGSSFTVAPQSS